jgi:hypothetical protein
LLGVFRRLKQKPISEQKVENIFVARHIAKAILGAGVSVHRACKPLSLLSCRVIECRLCVAVFIFFEALEIF